MVSRNALWERKKRHNGVLPPEDQQMCPICWQLTTLIVDHDHRCCPPPPRGKGPLRACGLCVRGFICSPCNTTLGMSRENPAVLRRAAEYLEDANGETTR